MRILLLSLVCLFGLAPAHSQVFDSPSEFNDLLIMHQNTVMQANLDYFAKLVHSNRARKIENKRKEVLSRIESARKGIEKASYKGEGGEVMQKEAYSVMMRFKQLFTVDLVEVVRLSDHCEDSYDAMELYFKAQDEAHEKLKAASAQFDAAQKEFAAANNMTLIESEDKNADKIDRANRVSRYQRGIYLSYFRVYKDDGRFTDALAKADVPAMELSQQQLKASTVQTLGEIKGMKSFEGEDGYRLATLETVKYLDAMANKDYNVLIAFHKKDQKARKKADVDAYNAVVAKMNKEGNYHINQMNKTQSKLMSKMVAKKF